MIENDIIEIYNKIDGMAVSWMHDVFLVDVNENMIYFEITHVNDDNVKIEFY